MWLSHWCSYATSAVTPLGLSFSKRVCTLDRVRLAALMPLLMSILYAAAVTYITLFVSVIGVKGLGIHACKCIDVYKS